MATAKIAIELDEQLLAGVDRLVKNKVFASRSEAIQAAVREKVESLSGGLLAQECHRLDPGFEQAMAEEGISEDSAEWPTY